jgi:DNA-binding MarR family transcriptional regulator
LGSDGFIERLSGTTENMREVPRAQWQAVKPSLSALLGKRGEQAIAVAYREYGYCLREIVGHLEVHYATVSRKLRALETRGKRLA